MNTPSGTHLYAAPQPPATELSSGDKRLVSPVKPPADAQAQGGGEVVAPMTGDLLPCPFCGKSNQDRWPCEWLDGSGANVIRCVWCHGAAPASTWNRRTAPPSAPVGVEGTWLWSKLMDWCREQRIAPATQDKLFAIAGEAHRLNALAQQPAAVDNPVPRE